MLGLATSLNQFSRSVGAAIGVAVMGAILARTFPESRWTRELTVFLRRLVARGPCPRAICAGSEQVFGAGVVMSAIGLAASFALPPVQFAHGVSTGAGGRMLAAEMANVEAGDGGTDKAARAEMPGGGP